MIVAVFAVVGVLVIVEIDFRPLPKPQFQILAWERNWAVLYDLLLANQLELRHRTDQFRLDPDYLKVVRRNPSAAFQPHRKALSTHDEKLERGGPAFALLKVNQPRRLLMPAPQPFACHLEVFPLAGVKYQSQPGEPGCVSDFLGNVVARLAL